MTFIRALVESRMPYEVAIKRAAVLLPKEATPSYNCRQSLPRLVDALLSHVTKYSKDEVLLTLVLTVLIHFCHVVHFLQESVMTLVFGSLSWSSGVTARYAIHARIGDLKCGQ